ncbi:hypothetical protein [Neobacillus drentensis]|uniref:hypothetical protein n=1 Tax=Neobacillus drentensis TaxID=220684 RepID=UPI003001DEE2
MIGLGIGFIFGYFYENGEVTKEMGKDIKTATAEEDKSDGSNKSYQFQDIESMEKATSVKEAYERIFGKDRLFDDFKDGDPERDPNSTSFKDFFDGEIKYDLNGYYEFKNLPPSETLKYYPDKPYSYQNIYFNIAMKPGLDTRMEMIDFLHYLQSSGLTKPHLIKESLPEGSVRVNSVDPHPNAGPEKNPSFNIYMNVFQKIKPGMNKPESHQRWSISSDVIEVMDFSDKETMLGEIDKYGKFEGVNPSGMNGSHSDLDERFLFKDKNIK